MTRTPSDKPSAVSLLDSLAASRAIAASDAMPSDVADIIEREDGVFIRAPRRPELDLSLEAVSGTTDLWRVVNTSPTSHFSAPCRAAMPKTWERIRTR